MAWIVVRICAASIAFALASGVVCAQNQQTLSPLKSNIETSAQQRRVISILDELAEQARRSENLAFAVRAQAQAATLLWKSDPERSRAIFRRAFESLKPGSPSKGSGPSNLSASNGLVSSPNKRQLRSELLNQIASRDPELAEELARSLADLTESSDSGCGDGSLDCGSSLSSLSRASFERVAASMRDDAERRELLISAALQIVERDPQQAMAFSQMSLALGISSNLARLLTLMRAVDSERADLLFSSAVARLEQTSRRELTEVHTLGSYVVAVAGSTKQPLGKALVVRFLNVAFNQIAQTDTGPARSNVRDQAAALYFIGRQLTDLFAQYLPDRLERWQRLVSDPGSSATYDHAIDPAELRASSPGDIALNAAEATDRGERDSLYARAALGWLTQGDVKEAQAAALKVADAGTRDRVLTRIARWYSSQKRIDDAAALVRRITDDMLRVEALAMLGAAALASQDRARALELLNEAESCAEKAQPSPQRADLLVKIAGTFAAFDAIRSFEVLQSAVKAINEITGDRNDLDDRSPTTARDEAQSLTIDELYAASFDKTLATLAKTNFDRALILAQQLTQEEASVIAQLAVCRGGLRQTPSSERSANADETESVINH